MGEIPLVKHTLIETEASGCFDEIILSSDSNEILELSNEFISIKKHLRDKELSGDHTTALQLVLSILETQELTKKFDVVALLLPTAPFRNKDHIREGFKLMSKKIDGVISLTTYEFPPQLSVRLTNDFIKPVFDPSPLIEGNTRSQDQSLIYRPNGGFYIQWMEKFMHNKNFWKGNIKGYIMERLYSVDIDNQLDLDYANLIYSKRFSDEF